MDPLISLASSMQAAPGTIALLLGSGLSRAAEIPTGWEVAISLARRVALLHDAPAGTDPAEWYAAEYGGEPDYSKLLYELAATSAERRRLLEEHFEPTPEEREEGKKLPTAAHRAIAKLVAKRYVRVVVTTNFDRLLEAALVDEGVQPSVIASADAARGAEPLWKAKCTIIKLHGDYLSTALKNTEAELDTYAPELDGLLDEVFDQYGLVVCGWSGEWDTALRRAMLRSPGRRYATYWAQHGALTPVAEELVVHRDARVVTIDSADALFEQILGKIEALAALSDPEPLSTAIAVAELKRYLPDPVHRIRLHDLVIGIAGRVRDATSREAFRSDTPSPNGSSVLDRMGAYEAATAQLASVLATGAYFGDALEQDELWARALHRAVDHDRSGGYELWNDMKAYPATLCLYAMGISAIAADRLDPLAAALKSITDAVVDGVPYILYASSWRALPHDALRSTPEYYNRKTPASDRHYEIVRELARDLVPSDPEFERFFAETEYILGVAYAEARGEGIGPTGRFSWRSEWLGNAGKVPSGAFERFGDALLEAGLFRGDRAQMDAVRAAYEENSCQRR